MLRVDHRSALAAAQQLHIGVLVRPAAYDHLNQSQGGGKLHPATISVQPDLGDRGDMKEFNNWILAQFPSGGGEPVMLALASVAAQVPALGVAQGWCPC